MSTQASGRPFVLVAPNNDPGSEAIFAAINQLPEQQFRVIPSMRFAHFSELMKNAACMVGNSSAGVREAPFIGLSSLDVGLMNRLADEYVRNKPPLHLPKDIEPVQMYPRVPRDEKDR